MKHVIWDFNGTLLADLQLSVDTDNEVFSILGLPPITTEMYREHITMPVCDFYAALGVDFDRIPYEKISALWLERFNARAVAAGLVPGALETVQKLRALGFTQSVLSASYEPSLRRQCQALGLTPYMNAVKGLQDESAQKKTQIGRRMVEELSIPAQDVVLVGDMQTDAHLADVLGVGCILVSWGHNAYHRLSQTRKPIADSMDALYGMLKALHE